MSDIAKLPTIVTEVMSRPKAGRSVQDHVLARLEDRLVVVAVGRVVKRRPFWAEGHAAHERRTFFL